MAATSLQEQWSADRMFALYAKEARVFTFDDYAALLDECRRLRPRNVLEFGPGASTLALIEAGCESIVTCEYQDRWFTEAVERLKLYPQVIVCRYDNAADVVVHDLPRMDFDLAFVDSPLGIEARRHVDLDGHAGCSRLNTLLFALRCAPVVLFHDAKREGEQRALDRVRELGYRVEMIDSVKGMARIMRRDPQEVQAP